MVSVSSHSFHSVAAVRQLHNWLLPFFIQIPLPLRAAKPTVTCFSKITSDRPIFSMGHTFHHINVSLAGDFGPKGDKIKQWVEANGGTFSKELNEEVTHVISTQNAFRKKVPASKLSIPSAQWSRCVSVLC